MGFSLCSMFTTVQDARVFFFFYSSFVGLLPRVGVAKKNSSESCSSALLVSACFLIFGCLTGPRAFLSTLSTPSANDWFEENIFFSSCALLAWKC